MRGRIACVPDEPEKDDVEEYLNKGSVASRGGALEKKMSEIKASFQQFIGGFAVQTLVHLGKMSNPMSGETSVDLPNAKYSIDILGILQEKTRGNLTPEEEENLSNLLRDLRMEYVTVSGKSGKQDKPPEKAEG